MLRRRTILLLSLLLPVACGEKGPEPQPAHPAIRVTLQDASAYRATLVFNTIETAEIRYGCAAGQTPSLTHSLETPSRMPI